MSSKIRRPGKCQKCGWEYPAANGTTTCKFCGGGVYREVGPTPGYCKKCGAYCENIYKYNNHLCSKCNSKVVMANLKASPYYRERKNEARVKMHAKWRTQAIKKYEDWLEQLKQVSTHSLTEDEWMQVCRYFNGCALCGADSIDARVYFIQFKEGGKYNACNIIPACEACATDYKKQVNPFLLMDIEFAGSECKRINRGQNKKNLQKIVDYLQSKIEEVLNEPAGEN